MLETHNYVLPITMHGRESDVSMRISIDGEARGSIAFDNVPPPRKGEDLFAYNNAKSDAVYNRVMNALE